METSFSIDMHDIRVLHGMIALRRIATGEVEAGGGTCVSRLWLLWSICLARSHKDALLALLHCSLQEAGDLAHNAACSARPPQSLATQSAPAQPGLTASRVTLPKPA